MTLPDEVTESTSDDVQSVEFDIDAIAKQFIDPIEQKRSHAAPALLTPGTVKQPQDSSANAYNVAVQNDLNTASVDPQVAQESRAHTFYRMLGLPVMDQSGNIYNPGFNPVATEETKNMNQNIASNMNTNVVQMQTARETDARKRNNLFKRSLVDSSVFALVQLFPKKFQVIDKNKTFEDLDTQQFVIKPRQDFIANNYQLSDGSDITNTFSSYTHSLRPFLVNPVIERTVQSIGRHARVCVPFLPDKNSTRLENNIFLDRPGIEFILRLRLKEQTFQETLNSIAVDISPQAVAEVQDNPNISLAQLQQIAFAVLDQQNISDSTLSDLITNYNTLELANLSKLVRLINAAIGELAQAVDTLTKVNSYLDWTPLPSEIGLEDANKLELGTVIQKKNPSSELDRNILTLQLKAEIAKTRGTASDKDIGTFAIEYFENTDKRFENELNDLEDRRINLIRQGARAIRTIEIITGEQSGLGLVDILAVYTALWAIDLDVLISLLDTPSFVRLYASEDLRNTNVETRSVNGNSPVIEPKEALKRFEAQVINILDFADKRFGQVLASPDTIEGGFIPQGG
jgi:hypothetical protein